MLELFIHYSSNDIPIIHPFFAHYFHPSRHGPIDHIIRQLFIHYSHCSPIIQPIFLHYSPIIPIIHPTSHYSPIITIFTHYLPIIPIIHPIFIHYSAIVHPPIIPIIQPTCSFFSHFPIAHPLFTHYSRYQFTHYSLIIHPLFPLFTHYSPIIHPLFPLFTHYSPIIHILFPLFTHYSPIIPIIHPLFSYYSHFSPTIPIIDSIEHTPLYHLLKRWVQTITKRLDCASSSKSVPSAPLPPGFPFSVSGTGGLTILGPYAGEVTSHWSLGTSTNMEILGRISAKFSRKKERVLLDQSMIRWKFADRQNALLSDVEQHERQTSAEHRIEYGVRVEELQVATGLLDNLSTRIAISDKWGKHARA